MKSTECDGTSALLRATKAFGLGIVVVLINCSHVFAGPIISSWEVAVTHDGAGEIFSEITSPYLEPRVPGITKLRVTVSELLEPNSITVPQQQSTAYKVGTNHR